MPCPLGELLAALPKVYNIQVEHQVRKEFLGGLERQSKRWVWRLGGDLSSLPKRKAVRGEVPHCGLITEHRDGGLIEGV